MKIELSNKEIEGICSWLTMVNERHKTYDDYTPEQKGLSSEEEAYEILANIERKTHEVK